MRLLIQTQKLSAYCSQQARDLINANWTEAGIGGILWTPHRSLGEIA